MGEKHPGTADGILVIDRHRLDEAMVDHAALFYQYAEKLARAKYRLQEAKNELELIEAETKSAIRHRPAEFGVAKVTDKAVDDAVTTQKVYRDALRTWTKAKGDVDFTEAMVSAMEHRKRMIEGLLELFKLNYWAEPRVPKASREEVREMESRVLRKPLKRRTDSG